MTSKKIEPTGVMVDEAANILCLDATHESLRFHAGMTQHTYRQRARTVMRAALRAALNHPDAADLLASEWKANAEAAVERAERAEDRLVDSARVDEAARRVEAARVQIIENATRDDIRRGDHITWSEIWEDRGVVTTRKSEGIAHDRDEDGDWHTEEGAWITVRSGDAVIITIRRPVQPLPLGRGGVVLVPADGRDYITATVGGVTYRAREAILSGGRWRAVWRTATGERVCYSVRSEDIDPGVWKVDDQ